MSRSIVCAHSKTRKMAGERERERVDAFVAYSGPSHVQQRYKVNLQGVYVTPIDW